VAIPDVLHGIIDQSRSGPNLPAVKDLERELSYSQLLSEVAVIGTGLATLGVREGDRVALLLPNSVDFVVAALASLWIGAIFVPLATTDPDVRLGTIISDCAPVVVVTSQSQANEHAGLSSIVESPLVPFSALRAEITESVDPIDDAPRVAYAVYTSGTTGTPKGVQIGTVAFGAAVLSTSTALGLDRSTRTLCVSPFHFDGSFGTLFPTLFSGGAVVIRPRDALLFPRTFFNVVASEQITYTGFSPSYLRLLLSSPQIKKLGDSRLDVIALGGEASSLADIRALWSNAPNIRIFNRYGPTETTIAVTHLELTPELTANGSVPMGRPHPGVSFHLVSEEGTVIEESGRVGELYIGGNQLMDGYWGDAVLSQKVLRLDVVAGQRVYQTGDLVYRDQAGNYVYVDRADRVIKRSGVRISLVELSEVMRGLSHVTAVACATFDNEGELGIVAFIVTDGTVPALDLWKAARERLPDTMLPNRIELVEELPLNKSSKLDERRLLLDFGLKPSVAAAAYDADARRA
jgi:D-alanine--poly(phosphoribitol) ligase subunit 1